MTAVPIEMRADTRRMLGMPPARFLLDYWQKRPLLIRGAFAQFDNPVAPDDLAGLACEELALARIVVQETLPADRPAARKRGSATRTKMDSRLRGNDGARTGALSDSNQVDAADRADTEAASRRWILRNGPFAESDFETLPKTHWTLLVQDVDKWDADVAALLQPFDFLPSWRIDDVMISYAEDGGSVGAHVDQYDVFLLQGLGRRRWQIDARVCIEKSARASAGSGEEPAYRDDSELRLLREFSPTHEWVLEPGDMLHLPPGVPHHGVAVGACMTYSIGMRAPSQAELLVDFAETLAESIAETSRLTDPDLLPSHGDGEIDDAAIARVMAAMPWLRWPDNSTSATSSFRRTRGSSSLLRHARTTSTAEQENAGGLDGCSGDVDASLLRTWFGRFITRYRSAHVVAANLRPLGDTAFARAIEQNARAKRNPWSRCAWMRDGRSALLFVAGDMH
ncbi:MAG: cupin domain-containing protein, partial [Dokdonella sp.]